MSMCVLLSVCSLFFSSLFSTLIHHTNRYKFKKEIGFWKHRRAAASSQYAHTHTHTEFFIMVRRDGAEIKRERIQQIARTIQRSLLNNKELSLSKTVATLEYEIGLRSERIMEYLTVLEKIGQFTIDNEGDKIKKISEG